MKKIESYYTKGSQSIEYTEFIDHNNSKLRINIDRDSYDMQSSAVIKIWSKDDNKWNFLARIPYSKMSVCMNNVYCGLEVKNNHLYDRAICYFDEDIKELKKLAKLILN